MTGLSLSLLGLALIDSVNPSALGVTIYLCLRGGPRIIPVMTYLSGVLVTYVGLGAAILGGASAIPSEALGVLSSGPAYVLQFIIGAALFLYAIFARDRRGDTTASSRVSRVSSPYGLFALGVVVSVLEFATALPYLAALALITRADLALPVVATLLVAYVLVMLVPPLLILLTVSFMTAGGRLQASLDALRRRMEKAARTTWLVLLGIVGYLLASDALTYFSRSGWFDR